MTPTPEIPSHPVDLAKARRERYAFFAAQEENRALVEADDERERIAWQRRAQLVVVESCKKPST
jgi:hypothetical protein